MLHYTLTLSTLKKYLIHGPSKPFEDSLCSTLKKEGRTGVTSTSHPSIVYLRSHRDKGVTSVLYPVFPGRRKATTTNGINQ